MNQMKKKLNPFLAKPANSLPISNHFLLFPMKTSFEELEYDFIFNLKK